MTLQIYNTMTRQKETVRDDRTWPRADVRLRRHRVR